MNECVRAVLSSLLDCPKGTRRERQRQREGRLGSRGGTSTQRPLAEKLGSTSGRGSVGVAVGGQRFQGPDDQRPAVPPFCPGDTYLVDTMRDLKCVALKSEGTGWSLNSNQNLEVPGPSGRANPSAWAFCHPGHPEGAAAGAEAWAGPLDSGSFWKPFLPKAPSTRRPWLSPLGCPGPGQPEAPPLPQQ